MVFLAGAVVVWAGHARAADALQLTNEVFQEIEIKSPEGKIERKTVRATRVVPGTEVIYVITYKNGGDQPAEDVIVTNPVPKDLEYVSATFATGEGTPEVSVDGGKNFGALSRLTVSDGDGKPRAAKPSDVTHVRWSLKSAVKPGEEGKVSFRAKLE
jgi:uncharacterized repeat protein (TIGR01451 family)